MYVVIALLTRPGELNLILAVVMELIVFALTLEPVPPPTKYLTVKVVFEGAIP